VPGPLDSDTYELSMTKEKRMNKDIPDIGQNIPDFEAVRSDNRIFKLSDELKSGKNIKLMFYRGHW